jgi:hypothetical protein
MIIASAPCGCRPSARVGALKNIQPSLMLFARLFVSWKYFSLILSLAENNQQFVYGKQTFLIKVLFFARLFVSLRCSKMEKLSDGKLFRDISQGAFCCNGH